MDPSKNEVFRKILDRISGKELFRPFNEHIVKFSENIYTTASGKVIRKNQIALRLKSDSLSGKQSSSKPQGQKKNKRPRVQDSTTTSEDDLTPLSPKAKKLTAQTTYIPSSSKLTARLRKIAPNTTEERATEERTVATRINPVVDLTLSSSNSGGVIPSPVSMYSPATPKMRPPATTGSSTQNQLTTGTLPEIEEGTAPTSHSPKIKTVKISTPKSPAKRRLTPIAKQVYAKAQ